MRRAPRSLLALVAGLALLLTACGGGGDRPSLADEKTPATVAATTPATAAPAPGDYIAQAIVPNVQVYESPGAPTPTHEFANPWHVNDDERYPVRTVFFSDDQRPGWVKVLLPVRPNGSTGWVRATDVNLIPSRFRITVDLSDHALTVYDGDTVFMEDTVAVGKESTPTPVGDFFLRVLLKAPDPNTVYGPYAYGLSSHSETLEEFNGGDAEIGIHGNNDASVLGQDVSSGCIRMDNDKITRLASILPLGTPVEVRA